MRRRSFIITGALVTGLALGIIIGPTARGGIASAQTQPPSQGQSFGSLGTLFLDKLAAALGIQRSALDSAVATAGTGTVDEAVQQGALTQEQADALKSRIQSGDVNPLFGRFHGGRGRPGGPGGRDMFGVKTAMLDAAATTLSMSSDELRTQLRAGQTVAALAQAKGTTEQAVTTAALAAAKTKLDEAVAAGSLTQTQADTLYARLQQEGLRLGPGGRHSGRGGPARNQAPASPATPAPTGL